MKYTDTQNFEQYNLTHLEWDALSDVNQIKIKR